MTEPSRRRIPSGALAVLAVLLLAALIAAGIAIFNSGGRHATASPKPTPTPSPTHAASPSPTPFDPNAIPAGTCFNSPGLSHIAAVAVVPCTAPHDAESVAVIPLPAGLGSAGALSGATNSACDKPLTAKWNLQPGKTSLHVWLRYPDLAEYRAGHTHATCAIAAASYANGAKLTAPLR